MSIETRIADITKKVNDMQVARIRAQAAFDAAKNNLAALGVTSLADAEAKLEAGKTQLAELEAQLTAELARIESELAAIGV